MTTNELIAELRRLDPDGGMECICTRCSDYQEMTTDDVNVVEAVKKSSACYVMRTHESMSETERLAAREFIHFEGN